VQTVVETVTVSILVSDVTSLTFAQSLSIVIEISVDADNRTFVISAETNVWVVSVVRSAEYVPIQLPMFVTTMSRVAFQLDRYTTAPPSELSNGAIIGIATGAALIAAVMGAVAVFIMRKPKDEDLLDSDVSLSDMDANAFTTVRYGPKGSLRRRSTAFEFSGNEYEYYSDDETSQAGGWSDQEIDQLLIPADVFLNALEGRDSAEAVPVHAPRGYVPAGPSRRESSPPSDRRPGQKSLGRRRRVSSPALDRPERPARAVDPRVPQMPRGVRRSESAPALDRVQRQTSPERRRGSGSGAEPEPSPLADLNAPIVDVWT
jgi:hypothetical protein